MMELVCEYCGGIIPDCTRYIEYHDGTCFCNSECEADYEYEGKGKYDDGDDLP